MAIRDRVRLGPLAVDPVGRREANDWLLDAIRERTARCVVTVNAYHLRLAYRSSQFRDTLEEADLCVADGWPLVLASRVAGRPLPGRVAGVELVADLMAQGRWRVALLGGPPGVAALLAGQLENHDVVLVDPLPAERWETPQYRDTLLEALRAASPDVILIGIGAPKQELLAATLARELDAVYVSCGATLEFLSGTRTRAPRFVRRLGLEWAFRLVLEPRRLSGRYAGAAVAIARLLVEVLHERRGRGPDRAVDSTAGASQPVRRRP